MKKIIPFTKDIPFDKGINEILSISLDHDLSIKDKLLSGNFYVKGAYLTKSDEEDDYSYKIPFEITISDKYDISDTIFDIEDFYYETVNDKLRINIEVYIDGLVEKEEIKEDREEPTETKVKVEDVLTNVNSNNDEKYTTYNIYIFRETDTLKDIMDKYHVSREKLSEYNDLDGLKTGSKIIIPSTNE